MTEQHHQTLVDQRQALGVYFDALLREQRGSVDESIPVEQAVPATQVPPPAREEGGIPEWAQGRFQVLLFRVGGLTLAVPLVKLYGVLRWPESVTPVFGHASWFLGLVRNQDTNVQILDTARMVFPEHMQPDAERVYGNIILIDEGRCGLACDGVAEVITIDSSGVKWRSPEGRRPWLAGTVKEHMCALMDTDELGRMIQMNGPPPGGEA